MVHSWDNGSLCFSCARFKNLITIGAFCWLFCCFVFFSGEKNFPYPKKWPISARAYSKTNHTDFTTANSKNAYIRKNSVHCFIDIMQFELNKLFPAKYYNL